PAAGALARAGQQPAGGRLQARHAGRRQWPAVTGGPPRLVVADGLAGGAGGAAADSPAALPRAARAALSARTGRAHRPEPALAALPGPAGAAGFRPLAGPVADLQAGRRAGFADDPADAGRSGLERRR